MTGSEKVSTVISGEPVKRVKTMLVDDNGVDIEQMQEMLKRQADAIEKLTAVVESRDAEDADITRKLVTQKTARWDVPLTYDELADFSKDELDELHALVCRVGRKDLRDIDETPSQTVYKAARRFPKMTRDAVGSYDTNQHTFSI